MCKTKPDAISVDENVDLLAAKKITDSYDVVIGGNIPLTTIMLHGNQQDNMKFVIDLLDSMEDKKNFILSPGCDMPYAVLAENTIGVAQAVLNTDEVREMVKNYVAADDDIDVELPDYASLTKPLVEVFTLDSATCAACQYMMGAANEAKAHFGDAIDMVEYKFTGKKKTLQDVKKCRFQTFLLFTSTAS
ncbi:MAG: uroporphyrinogen decarboxylase family protein [Eubacterium sp.]